MLLTSNKSKLKMLNPLKQFLIYPIISFDFLKYKILVTNSTLSFIFVYLIILFLTCILSSKFSMIPNRIQACGEAIFCMIQNMLISTAGKSSERFFTFIFSLFFFILISNIIGMIPFIFTTTSHISVTFILAIFVFIILLITGFLKNGFKYMSMFLPKDSPFFLAPLIILIELFTYFSRPISLSIRLSANMTAGHVVLKILATFVILSGLFGIMPFILLTILTGFEIFVSVLQAYIFSILTCAYLSDALNIHN